jgi:hypothetical protein
MGASDVRMRWSAAVLALSLAIACGPSAPRSGADEGGSGASTGTTASESSSTGTSIDPWPSGEVELVSWNEIVFLRTGAGRSMLMTVARDGTGLGPIYDGGGAPRISSDGTRIAFSAEAQWWLLEEGAPASPLDLMPVAWSPVGAVLAAIPSDGAPVTHDLWVHDFDTGTRVQMAPDVITNSVTWSGNGSRLAYADPDHAIWTADPTSGTTQQVAQADDDVSLALSADGALLAYAIHDRITVIDLATDVSTMLAEVSQFDTTPPIAWSPDGAWIAWRGGVPGGYGGAVRADGSAMLDGPSYVTAGPRWSASSRYIAWLMPPIGIDCWGFDCSAMLLRDASTNEELEFAKLREMAWAPAGDLAVAVQREVDYSEGAPGVDLPGRLVVVDIEMEVVTEAGDLAEDDPRSDVDPVWRRVE